jgi:hypothetical protein
MVPHRRPANVILKEIEEELERQRAERPAAKGGWAHSCVFVFVCVGVGVGGWVENLAKDHTMQTFMSVEFLAILCCLRLVAQVLAFNYSYLMNTVPSPSLYDVPRIMKCSA